jgi:hypothetical protein
MPFFFNIVMPIIFGVLVVSAAVLWTKTKRASVLLQLIASSVILLMLFVEKLANHLMTTGRPQLFDFIRGSHVESAGQIVLIVSFVLFPAGYLWYALSQKRI